MATAVFNIVFILFFNLDFIIAPNNSNNITYRSFFCASVIFCVVSCVYLVSILTVEHMDILSNSGSDDIADIFKFNNNSDLRHSLGLTEQQPIPEPAEFTERDPLGEKLVTSATQDYITQLGTLNLTTHIQSSFNVLCFYYRRTSWSSGMRM